MIVEPSPLHSRSPLRRLLRLAAFVAPIVLLTTAIAAGALGPKPATAVDPASPSADASDQAAVSDPSASPLADATVPSPPPPLMPLAGDVAFPAAYLTLPTLTPSQVIAARATPAGPGNVLAVAGYLGYGGATSRCAAAWVSSGPWCDRGAILADAPFDASGASARPPHLHVTVAAGVVLPQLLWNADNADPDAWVPVVVVGRFASSGWCGQDEQACEQGFVVERFTWVEGLGVQVTALREPGQGAAVPTAADRRIGTSATLLLAVLARPSTIAILDPAAGSAAARLQSSSGLLWYLRELTGLTTRRPGVHWVLVDADGRTVVASGPSALPPAAVAPAYFATPDG